MGVNSLPKTVTRQRRGCDLNPGPSARESSTLTTRLPSHLLVNKLITNKQTNKKTRKVNLFNASMAPSHSSTEGLTTECFAIASDHPRRRRTAEPTHFHLQGGGGGVYVCRR